MKKSLSLAEQEIIISKCRDEEMFTLYSSDSVWTHRIQKICKSYGIEPEIVDEYGSIKVKLPKKVLSLRNKRTYTPEQRAAMKAHGARLAETPHKGK
jgi:hypothetical protein